MKRAKMRVKRVMNLMTYRITCVHYANVDGYLEGLNDTGAIVFTY